MSDDSIAAQFQIKIPENLNTNLPVLIVEDQQDMRLIICHHLSKLQFKEVIQASNGLEAVKVLRGNPKISFIIADMEMPSMGGLDLLNEIKEDINLPRVPFCLMMEQVSKEKLMLAVEHGVDEVIVKPLKLGDIRPKMASAFKIYYNANNPDQVYELAKKYLRNQDYGNAETVYTQLLINAPKAARPLVGLARVSVAKSESSRALDYLAEAEKNNPYYVHLHSLRGQILCDQGDYELGMKSLYHAVELSPLNPLRYQDAVNQLSKRKEHDKIASLLDSAVKQGVQFPELYRFLSEAFYNLKDYKKAIRYIRTALDADQNNITFLNQLAISLKESGETAESIKIYNKVIKTDPDNLQALFNKSILYSQTGQVDEALKILERLVKKHPDFDRAKQKYDELKAASSKAS